MAYSAPRTWDGTETTNVPTYLETIRSNNAALHARLPVVNIGFCGAETNASGPGGRLTWVFQHRLRYMHFHWDCIQSAIEGFEIYVAPVGGSATLMATYNKIGGDYNSGDVVSSAGTGGGSALDLNSLTVGTFYTIYFEMTIAGSSGRAFVRNLYESSEA